MLLRRGIPHEVLNAKNHAREAAIIANAGRKGAVTVATNMAGRGTDIMLGGNPEFSADLALRDRGLTPDETPDEYEAAWPDALEKAKAESSAEHDEVVDLGGLYVLGTERHESRRIDNQLRGRSGRQGDPGESRFYLSLGDDLMVRFNGERVAAIMNFLRLPEDTPIENKTVSRSIQSAQTQVEQQNFEIRKNVLKYDEVLNKQRTVIYDERRQVLDGADLSDQFRPMIGEVVRGYVEGATASGYAEEWELEQLWTALKTLYPVSLSLEEAIEQAGGKKSDLTREFLVEELVADAQSAYDAREEDLGSDVMRELERRVLLSVLDRKWREHLYEMDYLQEGIGLRAMAQRDPLVEYQREGFDMFSAMMDAIKEESVGFLFNLEVEIEDELRRAGRRCGRIGPRTAVTPPPRAMARSMAIRHLDSALLAAAQRAHDGASPTPNGAPPNGRSDCAAHQREGPGPRHVGPTAYLQLTDARLGYAGGADDLRGRELVRGVQRNIEHRTPPTEPQQSEPGQPREPIHARQSASTQALTTVFIPDRAGAVIKSRRSSGQAVIFDQPLSQLSRAEAAHTATVR